MNRGRREETFLKKGFLSPPTDPSSHLPKTFDLIESLFRAFPRFERVERYRAGSPLSITD